MEVRSLAINIMRVCICYCSVAAYRPVGLSLPASVACVSGYTWLAVVLVSFWMCPRMFELY